MTNAAPHETATNNIASQKSGLSAAAGRQAIAFGLALAITALGIAGINTATMTRETAEPTSWQIATTSSTNVPNHQAQIADASSGIVAQVAATAAELAQKVSPAR